jgi:hypothetical protein
MTDLDKTLKMLKSPKADTRYDACEELRVATESSPEVILALEEASQDQDEDVAERARLALVSDTHVRMASKMGRGWAISMMEAQIQTEHEPERPARKSNRLARTSLVLGITGIFLSALFGLVILSTPGFVHTGLLFPITLAGAAAGFLLGLGGLSIGIIALVQIKVNTGIEIGKDLAITGIVLGLLACLIVSYSYIYFFL